MLEQEIRSQREILLSTKAQIRRKLGAFMRPTFSKSCPKYEEIRLFVEKELIVYLNWEKLRDLGQTY